LWERRRWGHRPPMHLHGKIKRTCRTTARKITGGIDGIIGVTAGIVINITIS